MLILDAKIYNFGHYTPIHELRYGEGKLLAWSVIDDPNFAVKDLCMHVFGANFGVSVNATLETNPPPQKKKKKKKPSNTISDVCKLSATSSFVIINEWLLSNPNYFGISRRYIFVSVHVRRHAGSIKDSWTFEFLNFWGLLYNNPNWLVDSRDYCSLGYWGC